MALTILPKKMIEWDKVLTQAIATIVTVTMVGAAAIVWKGATSVDDKVQKNRDDIQHLIDSLSDKLANYQLQLVSISNQLNAVIENQLIEEMNAPFPFVTNSVPTVAEEQVQQKALRSDIYKALKK